MIRDKAEELKDLTYSFLNQERITEVLIQQRLAVKEKADLLYRLVLEYQERVCRVFESRWWYMAQADQEVAIFNMSNLVQRTRQLRYLYGGILRTMIRTNQIMTVLFRERFVDDENDSDEEEEEEEEEERQRPMHYPRF